MHNLEGRDLEEGDEAYEMCIRQKNLSTIAGKEKSTIDAHKRELLITVKNFVKIRKTPSYAPRVPFLLSDPCGMGLAIGMLVKTITAKGHIQDNVQFQPYRS